MAVIPDGEASGYTYQWEIENASNLWWLKHGERIESPAFIADRLEGTKWSLLLYPMGDTDQNEISIFLRRDEDCDGPDTIGVNHEIAFLDKDGLMLTETATELKHNYSKNENWGSSKLEARENVFFTKRETFIPEDNLTVKCAMWTTDEKPANFNHLFASTAVKVKRRSFVWKIDKSSTPKSSLRNKLKNYLIGFDLVINVDNGRLNMDLISFDESVKHISCNTSIIDAEGTKENRGSVKYSSSDLKARLSSMVLFPKRFMENKSQHFPDEKLCLYFDFILVTVKHSGRRKNHTKLNNEVVVREKCQIEDFSRLYYDGIFSDTELRTATKTFPAHKAVLSVRSPVFRSMFSQDMKEKKFGYVDINDFKDNTIHLMLLFIYSNSLEDLQFENAPELYMIADKYQILPLKRFCSSFFKENLCPANACDVLTLADLHDDDDLKNSMQDYILGESKQFFCSLEWKHFMNTHLKLAADIMYKKLTNNAMNLL